MSEAGASKGRSKPIAVAAALAVSALVGAAIYSRLGGTASETSAIQTIAPGYAMHHYPGHDFNFDDANTKCRQLHGTGLATLTDSTLMKHVMGHTGAERAWVGLRVTPGSGHHVNHFTNLNNRPLAALKWFPHEPNNANGNENCGELHTNGLLNDLSCSTRLTHFLCDTYKMDGDTSYTSSFDLMSERNPVKDWRLPAKVINYGGRSRYSLRFAIRLNGVTPHWTTIVHVGNANNQRVPGVWEFPGNQRRLHFRQRGRIGDDENWNRGCDPTVVQTAALNQWFNVEIEVTPTQFTVKYEGIPQCTVAFTPMSCPGNLAVFHGDPWYDAAPVTTKNMRFFTI